MFGKNKKIKAAIIGASGYTGAELIRLLYSHPNVGIEYLIAESNSGKDIGEVYAHLKSFGLPRVIHLSEADFDDVNVAFCCLPHATSQEVIKNLPKHLKIIDLSADFRLTDVALYKKWYEHEHVAPDLQKNAVYGLPELNRKSIKKANLIACPGCYPTSSILPLAPLLKDKIISPDNIIIDSKSGTSGAGRGAKQANLYCEVNEGIKAYNVGKHRHIPEIEQALTESCGKDIKVHFSPHLIPMSRGILSTIYVNLSKGKKKEDVVSALTAFYKDELFVEVLTDGSLPSTRDVYGTNKCIIGVASNASGSGVVLVSVIDNLIKGASGQAVQNMNIIFGLEEGLGLDSIPLYP